MASDAMRRYSTRESTECSALSRETAPTISHDRMRFGPVLRYQTMQLGLGNPTNQLPALYDDAMQSYCMCNLGLGNKPGNQVPFQELVPFWSLVPFQELVPFWTITWAIYSQGWSSVLPLVRAVLNFVFKNKHKANLSVSFSLLRTGFYLISC